MNSITSELRIEANEWRVKLDDGLTDSDQADLDTWLAANHANGQALAEAELFWSATGRPDYLAELASVVDQKLEQAATADTAHADNVVHLSNEGYSNSGLAAYANKLVGASLALAASVAIFLALGGPQLFSSATVVQPQTFATENSNTKVITLEDRTRITLGAASTLEVELTNEIRLARLSRGSAFFDIASESTRPFIVRTEIGEVLVTGTRFDVRLREDAVTIAVTEGSVKVSPTASVKGSENDPSITLTANQAVELDAIAGFGEIYAAIPTDTFEVAAAQTNVSRNERLIYVREPLSAIVEDLNRYADQPITVSEEVARLELSGTYDVSDVDAILQSIEGALPVRVIAQGDGKRIVSE